MNLKPLLRNALVVGQFFLPQPNRQRATSLLQGELLQAVAEPSNPHDALAVAVQTTDGIKLGYFPKEYSPAVALFLSSPGFQLHITVTGHASNAQKNPTVDVSVEKVG